MLIMIAFFHVLLLRGIVIYFLTVLLIYGGMAEAATFTGRPLILDADTIIMSGERIRLKGIDAPETTQRCLGAEQQSYPCGQVSTPALIDKIGVSRLTCIGETRDHYKRVLPTCYLDDLEINGWLVRHGYAFGLSEIFKPICRRGRRSECPETWNVGRHVYCAVGVATGETASERG